MMRPSAAMALLAPSLALACTEPNVHLNHCDSDLIEPANDGDCGDPDGK